MAKKKLIADWVPVADLSKLTFSSKGKVCVYTGAIQLSLATGRVVPGYAYKFTCDMNATHIEAKEGEIRFATLDGVGLLTVTAYKDLSEVYKDPSDVEQQ